MFIGVWHGTSFGYHDRMIWFYGSQALKTTRGAHEIDDETMILIRYDSMSLFCACHEIPLSM